MADQRPSAQAAIEAELRKHMRQGPGSTWYEVTAKGVLAALAGAGYTVAYFGPIQDPDYSDSLDYSDDEPADSDPTRPTCSRLTSQNSERQCND